MTTTCDAESSRGPWDSQLFYREVGKVGCTAKSSPLENPAHRTMATQEATPGSQSENSALELPSTCDIRDYMLQEPSQEAPSEAVSSAEALSIPSSSEVDPGKSNVQCVKSMEIREKLAESKWMRRATIMKQQSAFLRHSVSLSTSPASLPSILLQFCGSMATRRVSV
ncbi:shieldin complex subunit 1 isoform X4 [Desmodus rotundus]|uniref:shieldin complex subunit 1 isoform X4 n=1 Tax=Desmodus rotundus TaxID=9430 RepID=UPI001E1BF629